MHTQNWRNRLGMCFVLNDSPTPNIESQVYTAKTLRVVHVIIGAQTPTTYYKRSSGMIVM